MRMDVSLFTGPAIVHAAVKLLMPVILLINGMEDSAGYRLSHEDKRLAEYRSGVME